MFWFFRHIWVFQGANILGDVKGPLNLQILDLYKSECRDGRIKVVGGDNIEGLLISPEPLALNTFNILIFWAEVHYNSIYPKKVWWQIKYRIEENNKIYFS